METYKFRKLGLGAYLVETDAFLDHRGYFMEGYNKQLFAENGISTDFIQYNVSQSKKGTLRGLHIQKDPYSQARFMRCVSGKIFDVAVDVRKGSKTLGQHIAVELSAKEKSALYLPRGFANGFVVLSEEDAVVVYLVDNYFAPKHEAGILWNDPVLGINWPVTPTLLSEKDKNWPALKDF